MPAAWGAAGTGVKVNLEETVMRIALLGGTGGIGSHLLSWGLEAGHEVAVLARNPEAVPATVTGHDVNLTVVAGDATNGAAVEATVKGADVVLSALGPRGATTAGLLASAARNIVTAMNSSGARRLICVSAAGAFVRDDPDTGALVKIIIPAIFARTFADVRAMEKVISDGDLDWTLVRPARLVNTAGTGRYRVRPEFPPPGGRKISRADVAHFIVTTLEHDSWIGGAPALAY